ncbi:MAG TPA: ATP-binding cassette domain-containing protein, partial [Casimicrobiaceae bacterium]|nr:ATP-binding cassette domain-containing protein [Casimicrobiaceae bacterium]
MARLTIDRVTKSYGVVRALDDVSLEVADGELVAVLGASGCGKTTLLRQIAGFDRPDAGRILIGDAVVSTPTRHVPPEQRRIGIVFQSYALWPHMSVTENVAYGLAVSGVRDPERRNRVNAALALVELDGLGERRPALLSGGQRQR